MSGSLATLRVNASTVKRAQDARKLVIRMNLAGRLLNVLIVENVARQVYQKTHGQRVMSYAGTTKAPFRAHRSAYRLMCHGLGLSLLVGDSVLLLHLLAGHFHPVSRSLGTTTHVVDVKNHVITSEEGQKIKQTFTEGFTCS